MLLHVGRGPGGRRRLAEIAVLRRTADGAVESATVWHADRGMAAGAADLRRLLQTRVPA